MKNLILSVIVILVLASNATATPQPVNEKVLKTFSLIFKNAGNVSWTRIGKHYEAYFVANGVKTRALLDAKGNLVQTMRYYKEDGLPSNILYNIKKAHHGKEIWGVTEISNHNGVNYRVVLKDDKNYTHVNANSTGDSEVVKKYKRGDK